MFWPDCGTVNWGCRIDCALPLLIPVPIFGELIWRCPFLEKEALPCLSLQTNYVMSRLRLTFEQMKCTVNAATSVNSTTVWFWLCFKKCQAYLVLISKYEATCIAHKHHRQEELPLSRVQSCGALAQSSRHTSRVCNAILLSSSSFLLPHTHDDSAPKVLLLLWCQNWNFVIFSQPPAITTQV